MTAKEQTDLSGEWAWSQVEAMADGSLDGAARARMRRAMHEDPSLRGAVARAKALRRQLGRLAQPPVPRALSMRLNAIARRAPERRTFAATVGLRIGAAAAAAIVAGIVWFGWHARPEPQPDPSVVAVQEFELALRYLRKSTVIANEQVGRAVGYGLREALIAGRDSVRDREQETGG